MSINFGVVGRAWRFRDATNRIWEFTGAYISTPAGARPGSYWVESDGFHYIDEFGDERRIYGPSYGTKSGRPGSYWIEDTFWAWLDEFAVKRLSHDDVAHNDTHGDVLHSDSHGDTLHQDSHSDTLHSDTHTDVPHTDTHGDTSHVNIYWDRPHSDSPHQDFSDYIVHEDYSDHADEPGGCVRIGTLVAVWDEATQSVVQVPVEELRPGTLIYDYDARTGQFYVGSLVELRDSGIHEYFLRVETDGGPPIDVTFDQPFDVIVIGPNGPEHRIASAKELQVGWSLIRPLEPGGVKWVPIVSLRTMHEPGVRFFNPISDSGGFIAAGYDDPVKN